MNRSTDESSAAVVDVKQLGTFEALASLPYVFWIVGAMEMIERLAYYGVVAVRTLYAKEPASRGGLGADLAAFGVIVFSAAIVQNVVPIFTGGLSDRYGYKRTIFVSTIVKILGYLLMAWFHSFDGFFAGSLVLAAGTAIFKPGIQGTLAKACTRENSSVAWGVFYQTVNIGGFIGPLLAGLLRKMDWTYVFYVCAGIIAINFALLCTYREIGKEERLERSRRERESGARRADLFTESLREVLRPHVWTYLLIFSGFWFMFMALFDVLPAYIDDWVDTSDIVKTFFPSGPPTNPVLRFLVIMSPDGTAIQPEGMLNLNAGMIMVTCFLFAGLSAKMRATTSMVIGTLLASAAMFLSGYSVHGWVSLAAILVFSVGEMLSSPKFSEFIGNIAPADKKAMYLGFAQFPIAVGWSLEGFLGLSMYENFASKDRIARETLERGTPGITLSVPATDALAKLVEPAKLAPDAVAAKFAGPRDAFVRDIPKGEAFAWLAAFSGVEPRALTTRLHAANAGRISAVWYIMMAVGLASSLAIFLYGRWVAKPGSAGLVSTQITCPSPECGHVNRGPTQYCARCGEPLAAEAARHEE